MGSSLIVEIYNHGIYDLVEKTGKIQKCHSVLITFGNRKL